MRPLASADRRTVGGDVEGREMRKVVGSTVLAATLSTGPATDALAATDVGRAQTGDDGGDDSGKWGFAGLLGLAGLAGPARRDRADRERRAAGTGR